MVELIILPTGDQAPKTLLEALQEVSSGLRTYIKSMAKTMAGQFLCLDGSWAPSLVPSQLCEGFNEGYTNEQIAKLPEDFEPVMAEMAEALEFKLLLFFSFVSCNLVPRT